MHLISEFHYVQMLVILSECVKSFSTCTASAFTSWDSVSTKCVPALLMELDVWLSIVINYHLRCHIFVFKQHISLPLLCRLENILAIVDKRRALVSPIFMSNINWHWNKFTSVDVAEEGRSDLSWALFTTVRVVCCLISMLTQLRTYVVVIILRVFKQMWSWSSFLVIPSIDVIFGIFRFFNFDKLVTVALPDCWPVLVEALGSLKYHGREPVTYKWFCLIYYSTQGICRLFR